MTHADIGVLRLTQPQVSKHLRVLSDVGEAVETVTLHEEDGVTTMTVLLVFRDQSSRDSTTWTEADGVRAADGMQGSYDNLEDHSPQWRSAT